jgi:hypothetical protein
VAVECTLAAVAAECTSAVVAAECASEAVAVECTSVSAGTAVLKQASALAELARWGAEISLSVAVDGLRRADIAATTGATVIVGELALVSG